MDQYTELKKNEIQKIAAEYNLSLVDYEPIEEGVGNSNYLLRTRKKKYVLTIFEIAWARVDALVKLLSLLAECDFPTTRLLSLATGQMITFSHGKPVLVKRYVSGQVAEDLDDAMLFQIGATMAQLHEIIAPDFLADNHACGLQTFLNIVGENIDPEYESWLAQQYNFLKKNIPRDLPRGIIHGDLFYDNVLFEGKKIKAIIDFEEVCQYYKLFDLGMGIVGLCKEETSIDLNKVQWLLNGYQQKRVLEKREKEYLQIFIEYAATSTSSWRYWKFNIDTPNVQKNDSHWEMVSVAKAVKRIPKERFIKGIIN